MTVLRLTIPFAVLAAGLACTTSAPTASAPTCPTPTPTELVGTALATVGDAQVGTVAWEAEAARERPESEAGWSDEQKSEILQEIVDQELLFQEAFDRGLYHDPKVRRILVNQLLREEVYEKVRNEDFSEAEMTSYFEENRKDFVIPEKVQVMRLFVAITNTRDDAAAKARADELHALVANDPSGFREVAMASSEGPYGRRGGDLGYIERSGKAGVPQTVVDKAFLLAEGAVSAPFEAGGGYNILWVPSKRERIERTFEQMRGAVLRQLKVERYEELTQAFLDKLAAETKVTLDDAALGAFEPPLPVRPGTRINTNIPDAEEIERRNEMDPTLEEDEAPDAPPSEDEEQE